MRFTFATVIFACVATFVTAAPAPNADPEPAILDRGDGGDPGSF